MTILRLVVADFVKLSRYWVVVVGYLSLVGIALLGGILVYHAEQAVAVTSGSGYDFAINLMIRCVDLGAPILYVMICLLFALEVSQSTVKCILTRPVTRLELVLSKYLTAMIMVGLTLVLFWGIALSVGGYYYGLGPLTENEYVIFPAHVMYGEIIKGTLLLLAPFAALAAMGVMVSTLSSTTGGAIVVGLILYFFFQIVGIVPASLGIHWTWDGQEHLLPYRILGFPNQLFIPMYMLNDLPTGIAIESWWTDEIRHMLAVSFAFFVLFFSVSLAGVTKRDFAL